MAALPIRRYDGEVCLVESAHELARVQADLRQETVVGFDTETRPSFRKGEVHLPALVQVATARTVYLFRLRAADAPAAVAGILEEAGLIKAGIGLADDLRALAQVFAFEARSMLDLGAVAKRNGFRQTGVRNLAGMVLGTRVPKGAQTSNWAARQLTPAQVTYAATDAWICRELFLRFQALGYLSAPPEG